MRPVLAQSWHTVRAENRKILPPAYGPGAGRGRVCQVCAKIGGGDSPQAPAVRPGINHTRGGPFGAWRGAGQGRHGVGSSPGRSGSTGCRSCTMRTDSRRGRHGHGHGRAGVSRYLAGFPFGPWRVNPWRSLPIRGQDTAGPHSADHAGGGGLPDKEKPLPVECQAGETVREDAAGF